MQRNGLIIHNYAVPREIQNRGECAITMFDALLVVGGSVLTLFLLMSVGFIFGRMGLLSGETLSQVSRVLLYVVTPCIMITSFEVERTPESQGMLFASLGAMAEIYVVYMLLSIVLFRREGEEHRGILRFASVYGNAGFMGLPLIQSVMGDEAMMVAVVGLAVFNIVTWTQGRALIGGRAELSWKKLALNPGIIGFVVGLLLYFTGWRFPGPVDSAVAYLGSLNTPLAMVVIGGQMAQSDLVKVFSTRKLYLVSAVKLAGLPLVTAGLLLPFRLDPTVYVAAVILAACPTAGATSLFAQSMGKDAALGAQQVTLSTLLCMATLPVMAMLAQLLAAR